MESRLSRRLFYVLNAKQVHKDGTKGERDMISTSIEHKKIGGNMKAIMYMELAAFITMALTAVACAVMISMELIPETVSHVCNIVCLFISTLVGGLMISDGNRIRQSVLRSIGAIIEFTMLLCVNVLLLGGKFDNVGTNALVIMFGAGTSVALGCLNVGKNKRQYKYRYR